MRKIFCLLFVGVVGLLLFSTGSAVATDTEIDRSTLRGLKGVGVLVDNIRKDAEEDGMTQNQLQTDVELRLQKAGIPVLNKAERLEAPGAPYLYVSVTTLKNEDLFAAFSIKVELQQRVVLERDSGISGFAATWSAGGTGTVGSHNLREIRKFVGDDIDRFINAYLSVNPK